MSLKTWNWNEQSWLKIGLIHVSMTVFEFLSSGMKHSSTAYRLSSSFKSSQWPWCGFRLNLTIADLACRFAISTSTTSVVILKWIKIAYNRLEVMLKWPNWDDLLATTKVAVIVYCFEVFCHQPKNHRAKAATFSSYKHHNAAKFLIGVKPQGVIKFVSKEWGGRTPDKHLTENCGVMKYLLPDDVILDDRGFDIGDSNAHFWSNSRDTYIYERKAAHSMLTGFIN